MTEEVSALLLDAGMLMITGMTVVFVFLSLGIGAIHLIRWIDQMLPATDSEELAPARPTTSAASSQGIPDDTIAVISAAIHQHRQSQR